MITGYLDTELRIQYKAWIGGISIHSAAKSPMTFARAIAKVIGLFSLPRKNTDFYGGPFRSEVIMLLYNDRYSILNTEEWNMFL